jgi:hypothetical protein
MPESSCTLREAMSGNRKKSLQSRFRVEMAEAADGMRRVGVIDGVTHAEIIEALTPRRTVRAIKAARQGKLATVDSNADD